MGKRKKGDDQEVKKYQKRAPGNISWRQRKRDVRKFREKKLLQEIISTTPKVSPESEEKEETIADAETSTDVIQDSAEHQKRKEDVIGEKKGRFYTVSIAIPGSIMENAQSAELRSYLAGQIARAAVIFEIDEIIVFDETAQMTEQQMEMYASAPTNAKSPNCNARMAKILQYLECPQYLRKALFPLQEDLQYAGLLNPLDCLHHLRSDDLTIPYREAVILDKPTKSGKGSFCDAGFKKEVQVDQQLKPRLRVTVELKTFDIHSNKVLKGVIVSPSTPTRKCGYYWGYNVRLARSLNAVFTDSPYKQSRGEGDGGGGYDLIIGTSDKGQEVDGFQMPPFKHALIVFGGVQGLEFCVENDESLKSTEDPSELFQFYLNTCPNQGSRTIRTEEAVFITLSSLRPKIRIAGGIRRSL